MARTFRTIAIALVIIGALFKIQHWPGIEALAYTAWGFAVAALLWWPLSGQPLLHQESARNVFTLGLISSIVLGTLHLPGKGYALAIAVLGGVALLWLDRDRLLPGKSDKGSKPWLFYMALALVIVGTLFRIQHWPHGTVLLLGGLAVGGYWFFSSMHGERQEK